MADSFNFNLNNFLKTYQQTTYDPAKQHAAAEENMEQRRIEQAEEAIQNNFGSLTLSEKLAELGYGERVLQQIGDTAKGMVGGLVNPILDYLKQADKVTDQDAYNAEIQSYAKQMFFASQAMGQDASLNPVGQKFVLDM